MIDNILICPCKSGQTKEGVDDGSNVIKDIIQHKLQSYDYRNYVEVNQKENESNEDYHERIFIEKNSLVGNTLTIGGDHSIAIGSVLSSINQYNDTCVIWIDAHPDINTFESSNSKNFHGMPLSFISGLESQWKWTHKLNKLKLDKLFYFGIRDIDNFEMNIIKNHNIVVLKDVSEVLKIINNNKHIHISFDVDSLDPQYMYSTGTPYEIGIDLTEILYLFQKLVEYTNYTTISMDITEYNPLIGTEYEKYISKNTITKLIDSLF